MYPIIRKYKNQHFNDYILNLRIQYIVNQLESNKIMLDYKLSFLADMSGFTSHSKFTIAFKNVMNITPSQFIEQLKANKE
ncbi:helix-turn-helix domain-containing protein [Sphingobacterium daejeonense]|uniref:Helix-turn-helix domain-containing protein n=1 Tax=Sphingobacterium daejeonense TaxID=371142 RepID=A0ABW3RQ77_9SPHI